MEHTITVVHSLSGNNPQFTYPTDTELGQVIIDLLGDDTRHRNFIINNKIVGRFITLGRTLSSLCSEGSSELNIYWIWAFADAAGQGVEGYVKLYKKGIKGFPALNWEDGDCISLNPFGTHGMKRVPINYEYHTFINNTPNNLIITVRGEHRLVFNKISFAKHVQESRRCPLTRVEITDEHMVRIGEIVSKRAPFQELVIE